MAERVWVITGTSSGLGLAMAKYMLSQGDKVIATVRSLEKFPSVLEEGGAKPLIVDFNNSDDEVICAAKTAIEFYGRVDVLVNNVGGNSGVGPVEEISMDDIRSQFQTNLFGPIAFSKPFITHFRTRRAGHVLNLSSLSSMLSHPSFAAYTGSKAGLDSFTDALAAELAPFGVRVHLVLPGYFPTNIFVSHPHFKTTDTTPGPTEMPVAEGLSQVYTEESQGWNLINTLPRNAQARGWMGDMDKFATRIYEIVTDTGMAKELGINDEPWLRVPMGSDCGFLVQSKLNGILDNFKATEPFWRSTDVYQNQKQ
ncbi:NAD-P-binding protein [Irpex rosettiformis]|uniref:NAD-P-binding protein n=1 Tax=Irpex rosettiformis TaxID=378272 RepID=A0ACB8U8I6_9APHY|nr:NAD-P-binding protein [Irpex rosettiformis]